MPEASEAPPPVQTKMDVEIQNLSPDEVLKSATEKYPDLQKVEDQKAMKDVLQACIDEMKKIQEVSHTRRFDIPSDIAQKIKAVWIFGGPGTYDLPVFEDDTYKDHQWAYSMDRRRLNDMATLVRNIAEIKAGTDQSHRPLGEKPTQEDIAETRSLIENNGPTIIYNGGDKQKEVIRKYLDEELTIIPKDKMLLGEADNANTTTEIKNFKVPPNLEAGDTLAIVTHAPHVPRLMRIMAQSGVIPAGVNVHIVAPPTPAESGFFVKNELHSTLNQVFVHHTAAPQPISYSI